MYPVERAFAHRRLVQAFYLDGTMAMFATGHLPSAGFEAGIERLDLPVNAPQFAVVQRRLPGIYPETTTPYTVSRLFATGACPETVAVSHAGGRDVVAVVDIRSEGTEGESVLGSGLRVPYVFPPSATRGAAGSEMATGYSERFDFSDALREALFALPPIDNRFDVYPRSIRIVEVGIEEGGIANFRHLFVRVQRCSPPSGTPAPK